MSKNKFYKTTEWLKIRKLVIINQGGICSRCSNPAYFVHHKEYLTDDNYLDPNISMNMNNLEALCIECHNEEHHPSISTRQGLKFDDKGNIIQRL